MTKTKESLERAHHWEVSEQLNTLQEKWNKVVQLIEKWAYPFLPKRNWGRGK